MAASWVTANWPKPRWPQPVPEKVTLKDPKEFRIIGRPTSRLDARAKSSGQQDFGIDVRLPGQLTAVVARPPVFGARLASVDDSAARAVKGVKAVLRVPLDGGAEGVAVVADGYWQATQGREALKLQWDTSAVEKVDSERQLAQYRELAARPGPRKLDADMAPLDTAPRRLEAEFVFPYLAHAAMEPLNCTVQLSEGRAELWTGSQCPGLDGAAVARVLGLKPEQVAVHVQMAGGGFGRRFSSSSDFVVEACEIAKAARAAGLNAPVRTLWSREDDMRGGYYRPMHLHRARIGFDERGKVLAWDHVIVGQSITTGSVFERFQVKDGIDATATEGMRDPYPLPMRLTVHHPKLNVPVLWWRSVGSTHTAFVMETLIDEIARSTNQDPVAYRMDLFGDKHPRHRAALQMAVDKSGYGKTRLPCRPRLWCGGARVLPNRRGLCGGSLGARRPPGAAPRDRRRSLQSGREPAHRGSPVAGRGGHGPVDVPAGFGHHAQGRCRRAGQFRRLHGGAHLRHARVRCPHRAQRRAAHGHGRTRSATAGTRVRQCHRAADRQAAASAALQHRKQELNMSKVWFITGAGSGIGAATARAALKAGDRVVATGRNLDKVRNALRDVAGDNLAFVQLDVANEAQAKPAVDEAMKAYGRIDVLVNNAGYSLLGNFEELSTAEIEQLIATNFYGVMHVMRAVLPVMRKQRSGRIINVSSLAGIVGFKHCGAYSAAKFAVEGLSASVAHEVEPFGIKIVAVEPGFFRTDLLDINNAKYAGSSIEDYAAEGKAEAMWSGYHGTQQGDPAKLGDVLVKIAGMDNPPKQFVAGSDALAVVKPALEARLEELRAYEELSKSTDGSF